MVFQPKLAKLLGLNETIILNQIHYWLEKKKNIIDDRYWVYNTYEKWQEQICFLSVSTIKKGIKKLESMGIVIAGNFNKSKIDKTKWYTIDYELLEKIYENNQCKEEKDSGNKIGKTMDKENQTNNLNEQRTDINEQRIDTDESSISLDMSKEEISFNQTIPEITTETTTEDNNKEGNKTHIEETSSFEDLTSIEEDNKLVDEFKKEEGNKSVDEFRKVVDFYSDNVRLPGSYELEKIKYLCDEFKDSELIILSIKQGIERNARNLRYVETVLFNWLDNGIKNLEEAKKFTESYRKYKGARGNGKFARIDGENKCYNSKASSKNSSKWSGYKPPEPKGRSYTDEDGLI